MRGGQRPWLDYRTVWRWHFYAGLFCIPFVIWLSITGSIYLFKPQIERWLDRPFDRLEIAHRTTAAAQVRAALAAVPGSNFHEFELPPSANSASRIIVGRGTDEFRVYIHPQTLQILKIVAEDRRPMKIVFRMHGELLMGDRGSMLVELAASWAIVMILTGLYLWWPRQANLLAGVLYVRLRSGTRTFWRDLHAVGGVWVSAFALFLLLTGLPWAKSWGGYLAKARNLSGTGTIRQDWTSGRSSEIADRVAMNRGSMAGMSMHDEHLAQTAPVSLSPDAYKPLDKVIATVTPLSLAYPALISPPLQEGGPWTAKSNAQNRRRRTVVTLDAQSGALLSREDFQQRSLIDRIVGTGISAHEGQLFGLWNQLLGLATALALVLLCVSAIVLWWRRRAVGVLGAPLPAKHARVSVTLGALLIALAVLLPLLGLSMAGVLLAERFVLRRIPAARHWLGLAAVGQT